MIEGFNKEDIISTIQRVYKETEENRDKAMKLYDHMENAMLHNKGDLIVLSQMADKYLEQATRQTDMLVRLAQVMQKLNQVEEDRDPKGKGVVSDINHLITQLDLDNMTPFIRKEKGKSVVTNGKSPEPTTKPKDDVQLEADL
jgi:hypothetical protein